MTAWFSGPAGTLTQLAGLCLFAWGLVRDFQSVDRTQAHWRSWPIVALARWFRRPSWRLSFTAALLTVGALLMIAAMVLG